VGQQELVVDLAKGQAEEGGRGDDRTGDDDRSGSVRVEPTTREDGEEEDGEAGKGAYTGDLRAGMVGQLVVLRRVGFQGMRYRYRWGKMQDRGGSINPNNE
jgi:hypothetical protein